MKGLYMVLASLVVSACAPLPSVKSPAQTDFERALYYARQNVDAGNYWAADRLLDEFARTHPDTRESREIAFWKAAYQVDPANDRGSLGGGIAALDAYLAAADTTGWYRNEATLLRRTAVVAQGISSNTVAAADTSTIAGTTDTVAVVKRSRDEEIVALREQLAKTREELSKVSAELDRIKKRLANPSN
jgi:hypothetical protein